MCFNLSVGVVVVAVVVVVEVEDGCCDWLLSCVWCNCEDCVVILRF